ncbi:hypothetical protein ILUMI_08152 [Ignelater luminosus]|uniref:Uncharacterized protein n=1 Tax=Ignelater luminosus TaxID=2038154 RepID=A0A8K0D7E5_IGNLU|nr:hypothetical protein ILUMI_08152 [Ignelater luminosus]
MSDSNDDSDVPLKISRSSKKKQVDGRISDAVELIRNYTFDAGEPRGCRKLCCFEIISAEKRRKLIASFNTMADRNDQNSYLYSYNGALSSSVTALPNLHQRSKAPDYLYNGPVPLPKLKNEQLQFLKRFLDENLQDFYTNLPCAANNAQLDDSDLISSITLESANCEILKMGTSQ